MVKRLFIILLCFAALTLSAQDFKVGSEKLTTGAQAYESGDMEAARTDLAEAVSIFESFLEGSTTPTYEAYARAYLAMAKYYVAVIDKDNEGFNAASGIFQEAISSFRNIEVLDQDYVSSVYYRGMCSFRQYQIARSPISQAKYLNNAIGDFQTFISDEVVTENAEQYAAEIANANFFLGYCLLHYGDLKRFNPSTYNEAKRSLKDAPSYFKEAQKSPDERIALAAKLLEAECSYYTSRVFGMIVDDDWEKTAISKMERTDAIKSEVESAMSLTDKMISSSGAQKDLQKFGDYSNWGNKIYVGSTGEKEVILDVLIKMNDLTSDGDWGTEAATRLGDAQLLNYFIFNGNIKPVQGQLSRIAANNNYANYWLGWLKYINGDYAGARSNFGTFLGKISSDNSTKAKIAAADAKYRDAECIFWEGVRQSSIPLLNDAEEKYKNLANPSGLYYPYLSREIQNMIQIRISLINIEGNLKGLTNIGEFLFVIEDAGLSLPEDAGEYINVGRYFLEKGIKTAEAERLTAIKFATAAFDEVLKHSAVASDMKNKAMFMKGVGLVKKATLFDGAEKTSALDEARAVLEKCTGEFANEAKYVVGITYFIDNDNATARTKFSALSAKGHIRAAYYEALTTDNCTAKGNLLQRITKTIKDKTDATYQNADLEITKLSCKGSLGPGVAFSSVLPEPSMTYEKLVDKKADEQAKKLEALHVWQKISFEKTLPDIDELISDKPPETSINVTIRVNPKGGEETVIVDGDPSIAEADGESQYKINLNRGEHSIVIKKKGYYLFEDKKNFTKTEAVDVTLDKAVRYTKSNQLESTANPMAISSNGDDLFVANNKSSQILHIGSDGSVKNKIKYDALGVVTVTGMAIDKDVVLVSDSRHNLVVMTSFDGAEVNVVAYGNETYGDSKLNNPSAIAADQGTYYIVDSSNKRVLVFEGSSFRRAFGSEELVKPVGIVVDPINEKIMVADVIKGAVVVYSTGGEKLEEVKFASQPTPSYLYRDEDGYVYVADFVTNTVGKYTSDLELLAIASNELVNPRGVTLLGLGPDATMYVATEGKVSVLKGGWDNQYMPE